MCVVKSLLCLTSLHKIQRRFATFDRSSSFCVSIHGQTKGPPSRIVKTCSVYLIHITTIHYILRTLANIMWITFGLMCLFSNRYLSVPISIGWIMITPCPTFDVSLWCYFGCQLLGSGGFGSVHRGYLRGYPKEVRKTLRLSEFADAVPKIINFFRVWIFEGTCRNLYHQSYQLLQYMSKCDDFQNETLWLLPFLPRLAWENSRSHSLLTLETNRSCVISYLWSVSCLLRVYRIATTSRGNRACNFLISNMISKYILTWI